MSVEVVVGAVIGATVSLITTAAYDIVKDKAKEDRSRRVNSASLIKELEMNLEYLKENESTGDVDESLLLHTSVFDSIISSGEFSSLNETVQQSLQQVYAAIKQNNQYAALYSSILFQQTERIDSSGVTIKQLIANAHKSLKKMIPDMIIVLRNSR
ncbi:hypothetical protein [Nitrososphaera sp.]|uniref:hypothetical protein n=1 Tax=Nitrososphaera sp. TaxID=1971748 RepID=UPI0017B3908D|nr:hypothetical protein [Nitrososphaera sp.]NWG36997.1 hypothetical protein [Nitrososphaera sp.]